MTMALTEVFCDREFSTEGSSSVIAHVYYSTEERKLFVELVPRGEEAGVVAGYQEVPDTIFRALAAINANRLGGDETASVGRYWNQWIKPYLNGLDTDDIEIVTQEDLNNRAKLSRLLERRPGFWADETVEIDPEPVGPVDAPQATILPVEPPQQQYRFAVTFESGEEDVSLAVKATDINDALARFHQATRALGWEPVVIKSVTQFYGE